MIFPHLQHGEYERPVQTLENCSTGKIVFPGRECHATVIHVTLAPKRCMPHCPHNRIANRCSGLRLIKFSYLPNS